LDITLPGCVQATASTDFTDALDLFNRGEFTAVVICASATCLIEALRFVRQVRLVTRHLPIVLVTSHSSEQLAIDALNSGVTVYLRHPLDADGAGRLTAAISQNGSTLADAADPLDGDDRLVGSTLPMSGLRDRIKKAARCHSNVLITGETGTGKELVAELIHQNSPRRSCPFVCLNSTAIPDSLLESELFGYERGAFTGATASHRGKLALANTGTIFFDEIGDTSALVQAKLLRAIDGKAVYRLGSDREIPLDVRILAATNQDLDSAMEQGRFRRDLYYRLNVVRIQVPPLRDRREDIPQLVAHYVTHFNRRFGEQVEGFTPDAMGLLISYCWPGNIRELKNVVESTFVNFSGYRIGVASLPPCITTTSANGTPRSEREQLLMALAATNWNKTKAAERLCWSRMTLYRKMASYNVARPARATQSAAS
jgi:DNA-binding NtrC family response regulator